MSDRSQTLIRAYAVLQGGGVKGAALAGAIAASQDRGIRFLGYGGASAGAIVAALFATGYTGDEIRGLLVNQAHPRNLLDEQKGTPSKLSILLGLYKELRRTFGPRFGLKTIARFWLKNRRAIAEVRGLNGVGLYSGKVFVATLEQLLQLSPVGEALAGRPITFGALKEQHAPKLKIVAANLSTGEATIFDADNTPEVEIVSAVRASMSFPFVFEPHIYKGHRLSDGGLASNLPVFLFKAEHARTGNPILGVDLSEPARDRQGNYDLLALLDDLASCALEASDRLFRDLITGVDVITVQFEKRISALNFDIVPSDIRAMYGWGENSANKFLNHYGRLRIALRSRDDKVRQLQALFGAPKIITPVLWAVRAGVEEKFFERKVKVSILLPLPIDGSTTWLKCYGIGYADGDREVEIESPSERRAIDECVNGNFPTIVDFESGEQLTGGGAEKQCAIYFPVASPDANVGDVDQSHVRAVLRIDTNTPLRATGWVVASESSQSTLADGPQKDYVPDLIHGDMANLGATWTAILYALGSFNQ
jgi:NTE family protein